MRPPSVIKSFIDTQKLVRRFNEDEAVWRRYRQKRDLRRLRGSSSPFPEAVLDRLDWLEAERECRERRYVGRPHDTALLDLYEKLLPLLHPQTTRSSTESASSRR